MFPTDDRFTFVLGFTYWTDILLAVLTLERFETSPTSYHNSFSERVIRYWKGIIEYGMAFRFGENRLVVFGDVNYAGDISGHK